MVKTLESAASTLSCTFAVTARNGLRDGRVNWSVSDRSNPKQASSFVPARPGAKREAAALANERQR